MATARTFSLTALVLLLAGLLAGCGDDTLSPTAVTVPTVTLDSTPPAIPTGVRATTTGTTVTIRWAPNVTDPDLAGYLVYRLVFGNSYLLTESLLQEANYVDARPLSSACRYAVTAVDQAGNESAWQTAAYDPNPDLPDLAEIDFRD